MKKRISALALCVLMFLLSACGPDTAEGTPTAEPSQPPAATKQLKELGTEGLPKYSPLLSPDGSQILYRYAAYDTGGILTVGVMDINGNGIRDIVIDSLCGTEIVGMDWLDDQRVGVTCHVNPSTSEYLIYDVATGACIDSFVGYGFARAPQQADIVYAANVPHWSDRMEYPRLMVDHTEIYVGDQLGAVLSTPVFSDDGSRMSFLVISSEADEGGEAHKVRTTLVQSTYDAAEKEMKITESVELPGGQTNYLSYLGNELYISNDTGTYSLRGEKLIAASLHSAEE